jgi:hypothetical protein
VLAIYIDGYLEVEIVEVFIDLNLLDDKTIESVGTSSMFKSFFASATSSAVSS